eukprot:11181152-Lingulodinium_polyedra.AAC.1
MKPRGASTAPESDAVHLEALKEVDAWEAAAEKLPEEKAMALLTARRGLRRCLGPRLPPRL